jgi:hypothetical protein
MRPITSKMLVKPILASARLERMGKKKVVAMAVVANEEMDGESCVANRAEGRDPHLPSRCGRVAAASTVRGSVGKDNGTSCAAEQMRGLCAVEP